MPFQVVIVPDKFKGTLTASAAAAAIAHGWRKVRPNDALNLLPMSDGGDGFGEVMARLLNAHVQRTVTVDAADRRSTVRWWWQPQTRTAILESAEVIGLAQHPGRHPYELDSFGLGAVLRAARRKGAKRCLVGVGGTATVDGGFGVARALGWKFLDANRQAITSWTKLDSLEELRPPARKLPLTEIIVAVDVSNPLLGPQGCARVYGPQKGLTEFDVTDRCLGRLAAVARRQFRRDYASRPGAGAAGGLGFGFECFLGASLRPGYEFFARTAQLPRRLRRANLVITGEGAIDRSTFMGKGVGQIARACREQKIPCIGLAGTLKEPVIAKKKFTVSRGLLELASLRQARKQPALWLERLTAKVAREWAG